MSVLVVFYFDRPDGADEPDAPWLWRIGLIRLIRLIGLIPCR